MNHELKKLMTKVAKGELTMEQATKGKKTPQKGLKQASNTLKRKKAIKSREVK